MWLVEVGSASEYEGHQVYQCSMRYEAPVPFVVAPNPNSIDRQNCSQCGTATALFGVEPGRPGHELLTFVCPKCQTIDTAVWKIP